MKKRIFPLPEAIRPGPWTILEEAHGGHSSRTANRVLVPLDGSPLSFGIRTHEMAHVKWSPPMPKPRKWGIHPTTLLAVEDARIQELLRRNGVTDALRGLDEFKAPAPPVEEVRKAVTLTIASYGTKFFDLRMREYSVAGPSGEIVCGIVSGAISHLTKDKGASRRKIPFRLTIETAKMVDAALAKHDELEKKLAEAEEVEEREPSETLTRAVKKLVLGKMIEAAPRKDTKRPGWVKSEVRWGEIDEIQEPPRPLECRSGWIGRRVGSSDYGGVIRSPQRLYMDGRIFARPKASKQGTILIDGSASMGIDQGEFRRFLEIVPGCEVACYSGGKEEDYNLSTGALRILAKDGHRVIPEDVRRPVGYRGANTIDGPALRWLATRPKPRFWISDGWVTGVGDAHSKNLDEEILDISIAHGITRYETLNQALDAILRRETVR